MSRDDNFDPAEGTLRDPRHDALHTGWLNHQRSYEQTEAEHHEKLGRERDAFDSMLSRKHKQADLVEQIELDRLQSMRTLRSDLDREIGAAQDIAGQAFANMGMAYVPGKSTVQDLYRTEPLAHSVAAERAGVPIAATMSDGLLKFLKFAGMIGCLLLGTLGMGALLLHIQPKTLFHSPLLIVALGLAFILVGGAYLTVTPASRRHGSLVASKPNEVVTKRSLVTLSALVAGVIIIVALVDAKALMAINAAHAMINPESAPSFALTFLIAAALSATYVLGAAMLAFNDGLGFEAQKRIEAEQERHQDAYRKSQRNSLEVAQACEALNAVDVIETRRKSLDDEIRAVEQGLRQSLSDTYAGSSTPPELTEEQRKQLRFHEQEARFAEQKLNAYVAVRTKVVRPNGPNTGGCAA